MAENYVLFFTVRSGRVDEVARVATWDGAVAQLGTFKDDLGEHIALFVTDDPKVPIPIEGVTFAKEVKAPLTAPKPPARRKATTKRKAAPKRATGTAKRPAATRKK